MSPRSACTQSEQPWTLSSSEISPRSEVTVNYGTWLGFVSGITAFSVWKVSFHLGRCWKVFMFALIIIWTHARKRRKNKTIMQLRTSSIIKRCERKKKINLNSMQDTNPRIVIGIVDCLNLYTLRFPFMSEMRHIMSPEIFDEWGKSFDILKEVLVDNLRNNKARLSCFLIILLSFLSICCF